MRLNYFFGIALISALVSCCISAEIQNGQPKEVNNFGAISEGATWVYLDWTVSELRSDLFKYTLVTDYGFSNDIACFDVQCFYNASNLSPCSLHHFELTPYYDQYNNMTLVAGDTSVAEDNTLDQQPSAPSNAVATPGSDGDSVDLSWDAPAEADCIVAYEICYSKVDPLATPATPACIQSVGTSQSVTGLEPCSIYSFEITALTVSGLTSSSIAAEGTSGDSAPGPPSNLVLEEITSSSATLSWDEPLENPECVANYEVTWVLSDTGEVAVFKANTAFTKMSDDNETLSSGVFSATVSPLSPCANYTFVVYSVSHTELVSEDSTVYGETEETIPTSANNIQVTATGTESLNVTWGTGNGQCVGDYEVCFDDPYSETENCTDASGGGNSIEITNLRSCTVYAVSVTPVSPDGIVGDSIFSAASTLDEVPGPPMDLAVIEATSSSVTVEFNPPEVAPQCVDEYDIEYIDLDANDLPSSTQRYSGKLAKDAQNTNELTGIQSCTNIWIMVRGVSPRNLEGVWANTTSATTEAAPSGPENLRVTTSTSSTISLSWFSPTANARCVDHYRVVYVSASGISGADIVPVQITGQYNFQHILENLIPDMSYTIGVSGITASAANGLSSSTTGSTTA